MCVESVVQEQDTDHGVWGIRKWVYCRSHRRPHVTGWCSVHPINKVLLDAKTVQEAYDECRSKNFSLFEDDNK